MLSLTGNKYNANNIRLYRDDGLAIFKTQAAAIWINWKDFSKNV